MLTTHGNHCREEPILTPWWIYFTDFNLYFSLLLLLCHYCLVTNSCPTLCDPMDCSTPGSWVLHYLPEFAWTHVHWVSGTFQPSHPVAPFSCPQSFPASGSFLITWLFFPNSSPGKESTCNAGDLGSVPGLGRYPGEGNGYPLQYSGLENSMNCTVHGSQRVGHNWVTFTSLSHQVAKLLEVQRQHQSLQWIFRVDFL